ncbi:hypothetical protein DH2020_028690 [Rehmannia glutinosa]|uniref:RanBD1 domain-containing protein n=1 Tax=Rehmannia glutinosa TaxID=99300 RepID=A0ABR0VQP2_REHGL
MRGTKRAAISDSTPIFNSNDSFMQSKRVIMGSPFDANKAEPSIRQPPLDVQRAESSKQHVRALNTQFASWVQAQLRDHPDELWEDGVQDYLNHARSIMEKFSDVVNWLKANAAKGGSLGQLPSADAQTKPASEIDKSSHKLFLDKPVFPAATTTTSSGTSWNPGFLFNNNAPFTFGGSQVSAPGNANAVPSDHGPSNEADGGKGILLSTTLKQEKFTQQLLRLPQLILDFTDDDVEQPSSPSVKKSQEKGIIVVHEVKCKLYVKSSDPADKGAWKDKGMGQLNIKCKEGINKGTKESKPTIVIRNDVGGKSAAQCIDIPGIKTSLQKNAVVAIFHTSADGDNNDTVVARTF